MCKLNEELEAYVGTYTTGTSKGIYKFKLNTIDSKIYDVELAAEIENPTYICIDKNNRYLYSVAKLEQSGGVSAFSIKSDTAKLKFLNLQVSEGKPPCHINVDKDRKYLFSANYHRGIVEVFPINDNGSLGFRKSIITHVGSGPHKNQDSAHIHYVSITPDGKYLCAIDLGMDKLAVYDFKCGHLEEEKNKSFYFEPGSGPRHMLFHPFLNIAYVITELSSEIIILQYCNADLSFKQIQKISTLPKGYRDKNAGGAIHISKDGKHLYASNRGHNSIVVFDINSVTGEISATQHISTYGDFPRDFAIDPTGKFLVASNQNSNNIVLFGINSENGEMHLIDKNTIIPNPVCIKFINS